MAKASDPKRRGRSADGDAYEFGNVEPIELKDLPRIPLVSMGQGTSRLDWFEEDLADPVRDPRCQVPEELIPREAALVGAMVIALIAGVCMGALGMIAGLALGGG